MESHPKKQTGKAIHHALRTVSPPPLHPSGPAEPYDSGQREPDEKVASSVASNRDMHARMWFSKEPSADEMGHLDLDAVEADVDQAVL